MSNATPAINIYIMEAASRMFNKLFSGKARTRKKVPTFRPQVEALEERITPVVNSYWWGPAAGHHLFSDTTAWHTVSKTGPLAGVKPSSGDALHFDGTPTCDFDQDVTSSATYLINGGKVTLNAHTWTINGADFKLLDDSQIKFTDGGHVIVSGATAGEWSGTAGYFYDAGVGVKDLVFQSGTKISITDDGNQKTLNMGPLLITGAGTQLKFTASGSSLIYLGGNGTVEVTDFGQILDNANLNISGSAAGFSTSHTTDGNLYIHDGGNLTINTTYPQGIFLSEQLLYIGSGTSHVGGVDVISGTLETHDYYNPTTYSILNDGGYLSLYKASGTYYSVDAYGAGYYQQNGGNFYVNQSGGTSATTVYTHGKFEFYSGNCYFNSMNWVHWNNVGDIVFDSGSSLYMTLGKNQTGDEIIVDGSVTENGTIWVASTGVWMANDTTKIVDVTTGSINQKFPTRRYGWTGSTSLDTYFSLALTGGDLVATKL